MSSAFENTGTTVLTVIIPIISGIVGWATNVLALKLTFYPLEFIGLWKPYIGWQGIIPMKAREMSERATDLIQENLLNVKEVFIRIDPDEFAQQVKPQLYHKMDPIIREMGEQNIPQSWKLLPETMKKEIILSAVDHAPKYLSNFMRDLQENVEQVFDLKHMVVETLMADKDLINQVFLECGAPEFAFIKRSGFYFGFLFGLLQMTAWIFYSGVWVLPVAGFIVGWLTNWIALKMIFRPTEPRLICCGQFEVQGLFLRRQVEVSQKYAGIVQDKILSSDNIIDALLHGPSSQNVFQLVLKNMGSAVDEYAGPGKSLVEYALGKDEYAGLKHEIACEIMQILPDIFVSVQDYMMRSMDVETLLRERMMAMTATNFEQLLHPVFEQDEWKLILLGGVLGALVGGVQVGLNYASTA